MAVVDGVMKKEKKVKMVPYTDWEEKKVSMPENEMIDKLYKIGYTDYEKKDVEVEVSWTKTTTEQ